MFNKYRNIKKIGLVLIGLALVIFLITNVRIRSVDSYRKQFSNMADLSQTQPDRPDNNDRLQDEPISTDNANAADNGSFYETGDGAGNGAVSDDNFATESTDNIAATDNNSGSGGNQTGVTEPPYQVTMIQEAAIREMVTQGIIHRIPDRQAG